MPATASTPLRRMAVALIAITALGIPVTASADGVAGPYLAAQQAERRGDISEAARFYAKTLSRDQNNAQVMERAMLHQIAAGNVSEGIALARKHETLRPGHHLGVLAIAAESLNRDEAQAAHDILRADGSDSGPFVGQIMNAWATFGTGDVEAARGLLTDLEASEENGKPGQIVAAYHLGLLEAAAGQDEAAVAALARAAEMSDGGTLRLARLRAGALTRLGRTEEAIGVIDERLDGTYGDPGLAAVRASIEEGVVPEPLATTASQGAAEVLFGVSGLLARGRNRLIALAYSRLATFLDPRLVEAQLLIAQILDQDEQYDLAIAAYDAVPDTAPEALTASIGKAEAMHAAGQVDEAVAAMDMTIERFPDAIEAHTSLGDLLRREKRFEAAGDAYNGAIELIGEPEQQHWVLFYQRGITLERSDQWDAAESDFRKALELEPDQPLVLNYLGYSMVELRLNLDEAEEMIEKAVEQRPDDGYIVDSLGWVLFRFGDFDGAVEHLERAVELRPVDPVINDHYGDALWMVGRQTEARFQWKRSLSFEPEEKDAKRIRRKLADGLDAVLAEEEAAGNPAIIGRGEENNAANESNTSNGG